MRLCLRVLVVALVLSLPAACAVQPIAVQPIAVQPIAAPSATPPAAPPTPEPDVYNQVPDTTVFEPGQCIAVLDAPVPAHTSNSLTGAPGGSIAPGEYEVGVAADYGSVLWLGLNNVEGPNYVNASDVSALNGDCARSP
jgi:hypothetical protein